MFKWFQLLENSERLEFSSIYNVAARWVVCQRTWIKSSLNTNILESNLSKTEDVNNKYFAEDEFVDDSGYTVPNKNKLKQNISTSDIELANKINLLRKSGLI